VVSSLKVFRLKYWVLLNVTRNASSDVRFSCYMGGYRRYRTALLRKMIFGKICHISDLKNDKKLDTDKN